jgi:hypothetical protein
VVSRCWREARGRFVPPVNIDDLPGVLLGRLRGQGNRTKIFTRQGFSIGNHDPIRL